MTTASSIYRAIKRRGQYLILRRVGQDPLTVLGKVRGYRAEEIVNDVQQGDREIRISNVEIKNEGWPGPPIRGDKVNVDGKVATVQSSETVSLRGEHVMHVLQVRGG